MFENVQRHYSLLFSSIFEEDFGLRGHNKFHSFECYQFVAGEDNGGKYIEFTGRSTKNFKEGLAHWKLYNKQIRHYGQPGKSYSVHKTCFFHNFISRKYWICPFHLITYLKTCLVTSCMHDPELFPLRGRGYVS